MTAITNPRPKASPDPRPALVVVPERRLSPQVRRRRARFGVALSVLAACAILFGLAGVHVLLTEGQFRLQRLQGQADDAQARYIRLRLEVAQLESPQRIVASAQQLGMVPPSSLTYLTPTGSATPPVHSAPAVPPSTAPVKRPTDATQGWAIAKPALTAPR